MAEDKTGLCMNYMMNGHDSETCAECQRVRWLRDNEFHIRIKIVPDRIPYATIQEMRMTFADTEISAFEDGEEIGSMVGVIGGYELRKREPEGTFSWSIDMRDMWAQFSEHMRKMQATLNELYPMQE